MKEIEGWCKQHRCMGCKLTFILLEYFKASFFSLMEFSISFIILKASQKNSHHLYDSQSSRATSSKLSMFLHYVREKKHFCTCASLKAPKNNIRTQANALILSTNALRNHHAFSFAIMVSLIIGPSTVGCRCVNFTLAGLIQYSNKSVYLPRIFSHYYMTAV